MSLCLFTTGADELLRQSCQHHGVTLHEYPEPKPWPGFTTGKLRRGIEFLMSRTEQYAIWIDGGDTLVLKPSEEIEARLAAMGMPVLIAAEKTCWPDADVKYPDRMMLPGMPRFINAGGYGGLRVDLVGAMHVALSRAEGEDDQRAWTAAYVQGVLPGVQIDHGRRVFCSEGDGDTGGADPCFRHWNGKVPGRDEFWSKYEGAPC